MSLPLIEPIRPTSSRSVPAGRQWRYELKLDGFRGVLYVENGAGAFRSKTNRVMRRFADLANRVAAALPVRSAILDGEIVVLHRAMPDFASLMHGRGKPQYAAFDLMWLNGRDLRNLGYTRRKQLLKKTIGNLGAPAYVESYREPELFEAAVRLDLEGIVAKRARDPYAPETPWLKIKHRAYSQNEGRWEMFSRR